MVVDIHDDPHDYTWRVREDWPEGEYIQIFCEGAADVALYNRLIGPTLGQWIRFCIAEGDGRGDRTSGAVKARNAMLAARKNRRDGGLMKHAPGLFSAYCLLDGEDLARAGSDRCYFAKSPAVIAGPDIHIGADCEGFQEFQNLKGTLFLNCYEIENLYLLKADLLDQMRRRWGASRELFGETLKVDKSWKILQRALVVGELKRFATFHNILHENFSGPLRQLDRRESKLEDQLDIILQALMNPSEQYIKSSYRSSLNTIHRHIPLLKFNIERILSPSLPMSQFHDDLCAKCDGKTFLKLALEGSDQWHDFFQNRLFATGFGTFFQMSLVSALEGKQQNKIFVEGIVRADPDPEPDRRTGHGSAARAERRRGRNRPPAALPAARDTWF